MGNPAVGVGHEGTLTGDNGAPETNLTAETVCVIMPWGEKRHHLGRDVHLLVMCSIMGTANADHRFRGVLACLPSKDYSQTCPEGGQPPPPALSNN